LAVPTLLACSWAKKTHWGRVLPTLQSLSCR